MWFDLFSSCMHSSLIVVYYHTDWIVNWTFLCFGCRIIVWIVSSDNASLCCQSCTVSCLREAVLTKIFSYALHDGRLSSQLCAVRLQGYVVKFCSSHVQDLNVLIVCWICCVSCQCSHYLWTLCTLSNCCIWHFGEYRHRLIMLHYISVNISCSCIVWDSICETS